MIIRKASLADFDGYFNIKSDLPNIRWGGWREPPSYEKLKLVYESRLHDPGRIEYVCLIENTIVGCLSAIVQDDYIEIGYGVLSSYTGLGVATAIIGFVVKDNEGKKIIAWVSDKNIGSEKCLLNNGFIKTTETDKRFLELDKEQHTFYKWERKSA